MANRLETFGDVRTLLLETIVDLKEGKIAVDRGMAIAANVKVLNENIQAEIAATKMALLTENRTHNFGKVVQMGRRLIADNSNVIEAQHANP